MKTILVTGGAGFIGSHTVSQLLKFGLNPVVADNLSHGFRDSFPADVPFYQIDVRNKQELRTVFAQHNISAVIHLAGLAVVEESFEKPEDYLDQNVNGTKNILELCKEFAVKNFLFSSSSTIYGDANENQKLTEQHNISSISPYGKSKIQCEQAIQEAANSFGLNYLILRYFNVAGASSDLTNGPRGKGSGRVIFNATKSAVYSKPFKIFGRDYPTQDGTCVRDYIHVEDIADIHVLGLKFLGDSGGSKILNCGYGEGYSVLQIVENFKQKNLVDFKVEWAMRRQGDPANLVGDNTELKKLLKWQSRFSDPLTAICTSAYQWEKKRSERSL